MKVIGVMAGVAALASALGPVLGGLMVDLGGWRLVFLVNVPIGLAALVPGAACRSLRRRAQVSAGPTSRLAARGRRGRRARARRRPGSRVGLGRSAHAGGVRRLRAARAAARLALAVHPAPVLELALFRVRSFSAGNLGALLLGTSFFGLVLANSLYLTQVWDYSVLRAGLAIAPGPLASAVAAIAPARFTDRIDPRRFVLPGAGISALAARLAGDAGGFEPAFLAEWLPATLLMGVGVGSGSRRSSRSACATSGRPSSASGAG